MNTGFFLTLLNIFQLLIFESGTILEHWKISWNTARF